jgi:peptidoglycan/LPS O-acetylase OafA/YrhL
MARKPSRRHRAGMHSTHRLPHLDLLRIAAFALLIPYHVGMYYVSWDWHVKSPAASSALEPFMLLSSPWRLGLLFFVAGVACATLYVKRGRWAGFARERSTRLLLPLLFGMTVIVTPQAYYEVLTKAPQLLPGDGGYLDFWAAYLQGGRYCRGDDCMSVPTWNHLWFLPYLWFYALLLSPLLLRLPRRGMAWPAWVWLLVPALPLIAFRLGLFPHFPSTHDLFNDAYNHALYGYLFALGWASRGRLAEGFWAATQRWRWLSLTLALLAWGVLVSYFHTFRNEAPPEALRQLMRTLWALCSWWAISAACGWAQQMAPQGEAPVLRWLSGAVFCLYILHQTVIVLLTRLLLPLSLPWGLEALLLILLTAAICLGAYALLRQVPGLRALLGISSPARAS